MNEIQIAVVWATILGAFFGGLARDEKGFLSWALWSLCGAVLGVLVLVVILSGVEALVMVWRWVR